MAENARLNKHGFAETSGFINVFCYDPTTKEYLGKQEEYISIGTTISANSTIVNPLRKKRGFTCVFDGTTWVYVEDNRGTVVYSKDTGEASKIDYIGEIKDGYTTLQPTSEFDVWRENKWVKDEEKEAQVNLERANALILSLLTEANLLITPYQDAVDLGLATKEEEKLFKAWKNYRLSISRIDKSKYPNIDIPKKPE